METTPSPKTLQEAIVQAFRYNNREDMNDGDRFVNRHERDRREATHLQCTDRDGGETEEPF